MTGSSDVPRITVVTPSLNQARFLERTICSVFDQGYPNLEYIIVDGGSTDGSVDIIRQYEHRLTWWVSEPDRGQSDAINKGLRRATGEWVAWQNSDDIYYPGAFQDLVVTATERPDADLIIGDMMLIDEYDQSLRDIRYVTPHYRGLLAEGMVLTNQAAFWRRTLHDRVGFLNENLHYCFDYEWFLRLTQHVKGAHSKRIWGGLRMHGETKTSRQAQRFEEERVRILAGRQLGPWQKRIWKMRRLVLMLVQGQVGYLMRGLVRYARGRGAELT